MGDVVPHSQEVPGPNVLLTDTNRWASAARIAIGLAKEGCRISAVCPARGHPLMATSVVQQVFRYSSRRPLRSLLAAIEATNPQIVIPCDDRSVQHLHELHAFACAQGPAGNALTSLFEYSLGSPESFSIVCSRCGLLDIAKREGVRVPDTMPLDTVDDLESWQSGHAFPWVLKGDGTFGGRGVRIAHTREQAERCYSQIAHMFGPIRALKRAVVNRDLFWRRPGWHSHKPAIAVQAYVSGRPANCGVVCWQGKVLAGIGVEVMTSDGATGPASIVRVVDNKEMMAAAERIARRLCLSGFFGLDFVLSEGSGAAYLIEMNPRCTPLSHLQLGKDRDLIGVLAAQLSGRALRETPPVTQNDMIAYFPQAWRKKSQYFPACFQDIPQGEPALVRDLMRPWPDRRLLNRFVGKVTDLASTVRDRRSSNKSVANA